MSNAKKSKRSLFVFPFRALLEPRMEVCLCLGRLGGLWLYDLGAFCELLGGTESIKSIKWSYCANNANPKVLHREGLDRGSIGQQKWSEFGMCWGCVVVFLGFLGFMIGLKWQAWGHLPILCWTFLELPKCRPSLDPWIPLLIYHRNTFTNTRNKLNRFC